MDTGEENDGRDIEQAQKVRMHMPRMRQAGAGQERPLQGAWRRQTLLRSWMRKVGAGQYGLLQGPWRRHPLLYGWVRQVGTGHHESLYRPWRR